MLKIERQTIIERELAAQGCVLVPALSALLECSEETVRRDLKELEAAGKLTRTHGGAYLMDKYDKSYPAMLLKTYLKETKVLLARKVLEYIQENEVILLDSSTTCLTLAEQIIKDGMNLTIVTNSVLICDLCCEYNSTVNLICLGGTLRRRSSSLTGYLTMKALETYYADKAFISCPKVTVEHGLSDNLQSEAQIREGMLRHAGKRFLLMDHTKFDESANILFSGLDRVDVLVTDQKLPQKWSDYADRHHMELVYCAK